MLRALQLCDARESRQHSPAEPSSSRCRCSRPEQPACRPALAQEQEQESRPAQREQGQDPAELRRWKRARQVWGA
eukprot:79985-Rhodomonas_salina.1